MRKQLIRFIATPFLPANQPSLGISNLLSILLTEGYSADIKYLNIDYGNRYGWEVYDFIAQETPPEFLIGEMIFTKALGINGDAEFMKFEEKLYETWGKNLNSSTVSFKNLMAVVRDLFNLGPNIISKWADEILSDNPEVIGFTSTFQQNISSLALAKEIKLRKGNDIKIIFGGANCEDSMGETIFSNYSFVDYVLSGEGENSIIDLINKCLDAENRNKREFIRGKMINDLNGLPLPNFDDYFNVSRNSKSHLAFESSRGCWWGMISHCTFCGLNGNTMAYRSKSADVFIQQLLTLSKKYNRKYFMITDNILDLKYITAFFPKMALLNNDISFLYETKSNINKNQLTIMAAGGISSLQPGIESLSTEILKLMGKGTTALQNIQLLRWGKELHVQMIWNLLMGFPNEPAEEYTKMIEMMPSLHHLDPPVGSGRVRIDRFGPYWKNPEKYNIKNIRPYWSYKYVYDLKEKSLQDLAYFFEHDIDNLPYVTDIIKQVLYWKKHNEKSVLELNVSDEGIRIIKDTRPCASTLFYNLSGFEIAILNNLDVASTKQNLHMKIEEIFPDIGKENLIYIMNNILDDFLIQKKYLIFDNNKYLSLVVYSSAFLKIIEKKVDYQLQDINLL